MNEKECKKCGKCCSNLWWDDYGPVILINGSIGDRCDYLTDDNLCSIYHGDRHEGCKSFFCVDGIKNPEDPVTEWCRKSNSDDPSLKAIVG